MSRLTCLTFDFPPGVGGVQRYLYEILRRIARHHPVTVITPVPAPGPEPYRRVVVPRSRWDLWLRALVASHPDRVLVGHAHPRLLLLAMLVAPNRYAAVAYGNDYRAAQRRWHRPLFNRLLAHAHPLITITRANARHLQSLGLPLPIVIYPGTDPARFTPPVARPSFPPVLLTVGRLVPRKGVDTVLRALPLLRTSFPDLRYRVVGSGPYLERLMKLSHQLDVQGMVEFVGRVPESGLPGVYQNAHIFVMPVREEQGGASVEGFGIVFLEAAASGLPVVTTWGSGAEEALVPGETGRLVPPDDPAALAAVLLDLLRDAHLREAMGQAGRRWVETHMTWEHAAERMEEALSGE